MTISHPPGSRLPLLSASPAVTFPAAEHHRPLAGTTFILLGDRGTWAVVELSQSFQGGLMASAEREPIMGVYNGGLGAVPPTGSRGRAPGQGGEALLKLKAFYSSAAPN